MEKIRRQKITGLIVILFLAFAVLAGVVLVRQRFVKPKATGGPPTLSFSSSALSPGQNFDLTISVDPNDTPFRAFTFVFSYDNSKVELENPADIPSNFVMLYTSQFDLQEITSVGNKLHVTGAQTEDPFTGTSSINLVKVKMKVKSSVSGNVAFTWQPETEVDGSFSLDKTDGNLPIAPAVGAKLYFNSEKKTYNTNDNLNLDLYLSTNGQQVNSLQMSFTYDAKLTFQNTAGDLAANNILVDSQSGFNTGNVIKSIDVNTRTVLVALATGTNPAVSGDSIKLATVLFKTGATLGAVTFHTDQANSRVYTGTQNILTDAPDYQVTIQTDGHTLTPTVTGVPPTPSPTATGVPSTPTPTVTGVPATPTPTPPGGEEAYKIDVGTKQSLTIQIGAGTDPQISFKFKLANVETTPDLYVKLRVKDELAFLDNPPGSVIGTCNAPSAGEKDFYIPVRAESGIYKPVPKIGLSPPSGAVVPPISSDGLVTLTGVAPEKYNTLILKGPKTRGTKMAEHTKLYAGYNDAHIFSWVDDKFALQPGDLPDPNNGGAQDCTVNSVDLSLISALLPPSGSTASYISCCSSLCSRTYDATCPDWNKMLYADVNYDGVVNGADISKVVNTLSTKPDDDL